MILYNLNYLLTHLNLNVKCLIILKYYQNFQFIYYFNFHQNLFLPSQGSLKIFHQSPLPAYI